MTPTSAPKPPPASVILRDFIDQSRGETIPVSTLITSFRDRVYGFLLLVFALLCAIPIPLPGIHIFLSIPLFYLTVQQMAGRRTVWFPQKVLNYELPRSAFIDIANQALPWLAKVETFSKPRLSFLTEGGFYQLFGLLAFLITAFLSIPLPLTNFVPAIAIALMALGILNKDGVVLLVGTVVGIVWAAMWMLVGFTALIIFLHHLLDYFSG
jgi:hypothetical protein